MKLVVSQCFVEHPAWVPYHEIVQKVCEEMNLDETFVKPMLNGILIQFMNDHMISAHPLGGFRLEAPLVELQTVMVSEM